MVNNTNGAKYLWQAKWKKMMDKKRGYTTSLRKMFPTVLGLCNKDLQGKVWNQTEFDSLESDGDILGLLNTIEQEGNGVRISEYAPVAYHQAQVKFYRLSQSQDNQGHTVSDHLKKNDSIFGLT